MDELSDRTLSDIKELNKLDLELYDYGVSLFEEKKRKILLECIKSKYEQTTSPAHTEDVGHFNIMKLHKEIATINYVPAANFGSLEVKISYAYVWGKDSGKTNYVMAGEETTIYILIESSITTDALTIGFSIHDEFGGILFGTNSFLLRQRIRVTAGKIYCAAYALHMSLGPGQYSLSVALHTGAEHMDQCYHWREKICDFWVEGHRGFTFAGVVKLYPALSVIETSPMLPLSREESSRLKLNLLDHPSQFSRIGDQRVHVRLTNSTQTIISSQGPYL
ncbi:MAG: Wzt carbohydrate-binding domain-containing protein, partial [Deltaproteobacteria bacterium]|nr:Wzt carbohydrate-binding domain-containing protein [Deltaproteobacteria bacterium]